MFKIWLGHNLDQLETGPSLGKSGSSSPIQLGELSVKDAVETCYALVFTIFAHALLRSRNQKRGYLNGCNFFLLGVSMENSCWRACFVYSNVTMLIHLTVINIPKLEQWLNDHRMIYSGILTISKAATEMRVRFIG